MATNKLKKLGSWTHEKSGITVDYFINGTRFECTVLEQKLNAPEAAVLRHQVMDRLEHWMSMEWFPIINVEVSDEGAGGANYRDEPTGDGLSIKVRRFYLSRSPAGQVMQCGWDVDEEHRKAKMSTYGGSDIALTRLPLKAPFSCSGRGYRSDSGYLMDFTPELWATLVEMIQSLGKMRVQLAKLFKTRDGVAKLQAGRSTLLGAGDSGKAKR